jgi:hypothetical protein
MYWNVRYESRRRPYAGQQPADQPRRHLAVVIEGIGDGHVTVDGDAAEMQQRCRGEEDVVGVEDVARQTTEVPLASSFLHAPKNTASATELRRLHWRGCVMRASTATNEDAGASGTEDLPRLGKKTEKKIPKAEDREIYQSVICTKNFRVIIDTISIDGDASR